MLKYVYKYIYINILILKLFIMFNRLYFIFKINYKCNNNEIKIFLIIS